MISFTIFKKGLVIVSFLFLTTMIFAVEIPKIQTLDKAIAIKQNEQSGTLVQIVLTDGQKISGRISPSVKSMSFFSPTIRSMQSYSLNEIDSIEILNWNSTIGRKKIKEYKFVPSDVRLKSKKGDEINLIDKRNILTSVRLTISKKRVRFYGIFYDYYKNGKWKNSKSGDFEFPKTNPINGVIKKIVFVKDTVVKKKSVKPFGKADIMNIIKAFKK